LIKLKLDILKKEWTKNSMYWFIENYLMAIDKNSKENGKKVTSILWATAFLISSIFLITVAIVIMVLSH
jgi:hypothetical protein